MSLHLNKTGNSGNKKTKTKKKPWAGPDLWKEQNEREREIKRAGGTDRGEEHTSYISYSDDVKWASGKHFNFTGAVYYTCLTERSP